MRCGTGCETIGWVVASDCDESGTVGWRACVAVAGVDAISTSWF